MIYTFNQEINGIGSIILPQLHGMHSILYAIIYVMHSMIKGYINDRRTY